MDLRELLFQMMRIRAVEEGIAARYAEGKMRCPTHLSIGQEGPAAAVGMVLRKEDYCVSTHRSHAHYLGKGGNLKAMLAEIYGKKSGCARGRGGSMHLIDTSVGFMGSTAIVGNSIPIGVGLGLASQLEGEDRISCIFMGDAATEEGVFYESVNFSVVRQLPILFVCENNFYSVYSPLSVRQPPGRRIFEMVKAMGIRSSEADGNDPKAAYCAIDQLVHCIRNGEGPQFIELSTYRWLEHCGPNDDSNLGYRTQEELLHWKKRDPIANLKKQLLASGEMTEKHFQDLAREIEDEIQEAFVFAENAEFPDPEEAFMDEYRKLTPQFNVFKPCLEPV